MYSQQFTLCTCRTKTWFNQRLNQYLLEFSFICFIGLAGCYIRFCFLYSIFCVCFSFLLICCLFFVNNVDSTCREQTRKFITNCYCSSSEPSTFSSFQQFLYQADDELHISCNFDRK